jgi:hypothetical protein
LSPDKYAG